jgi:hypothetical protein
MSTHSNIYTVNGRLAELTSRVSELEAENKRLRVHLTGALQTAINDAKHVIQDSIRVPVDGKDGRDGCDSTVPGPPGSVTYIGPAVVEAAVKEVRAELLRVRAAMVGRILQGIADNKGDNGMQRHLRTHLESILRDIENL